MASFAAGAAPLRVELPAILSAFPIAEAHMTVRRMASHVLNGLDGLSLPLPCSSRLRISGLLRGHLLKTSLLEAPTGPYALPSVTGGS